MLRGVSIGCGCAALLALLAFVSGCQTSHFADPNLSAFDEQAATASGVQTTNDKPAAAYNSIVLHEGDVVKVTFPGATTLDTTQKIRRDGMVSLPMIGEFKAAGFTPVAMEQELIKLYATQLESKEVRVSVEASAYWVYVMGAVHRPGKVVSDRPITALEAVMEAGGFDYTKANQKAVHITRRENGRLEHYKINLKKALQGGKFEPFSLKPFDIIYVPERFTWF